MKLSVIGLSLWIVFDKWFRLGFFCVTCKSQVVFVSRQEVTLLCGSVELRISIACISQHLQQLEVNKIKKMVPAVYQIELTPAGFVHSRLKSFTVIYFKLKIGHYTVQIHKYTEIVHGSYVCRGTAALL